MPRSAALLWLVPSALLVACNASVGRDTCAGEGTRCDAPLDTLSKALSLPEYDNELTTTSLTVVSLSWRRPLTLERAGGAPEGQSANGLLTGNGSAGLYYARPATDDGSLEVYRLGAEGEILDETLVIPPGPEGRSSSSQPPPVTKTWLGHMRVVQADGPAPVLGVRWLAECGGQHTRAVCARNEELIALDPNLGAAPLRLVPPGNAPAQAERANDGGLWVFGAGEFRKYDRTGQVTIRQSLLASSVPWRSGDSAVAAGSLFGISSAQTGIYLASAQAGSEQLELWTFDKLGNVRWRATPSLPVSALVVDDFDRVLLCSTTSKGDLHLELIDRDAEVTRFVALRSDYTLLEVMSVTVDAGGGTHVLTRTGPRDAPTPTLCRLKPTGDFECYQLPAAGDVIVGGAEDVVYSLAQSPDREPMLLRFDVP